MWRFLPVFVLIVLIPLPGWSYPLCELPPLTDTGIIPIPVNSNPGTLDLPDTIPDFFDAVWIAAYNEAISKSMDEETAEGKAYWAWREFKTDPRVFVMSKPMQEAIKQAGHTKTGKTNKPESGKPSEPDISLQPHVLYDGSNTDAVSKDINSQRTLISFLMLKPEEVLELYKVPMYSTDYRILFNWIEDHLYQAIHEIEASEHYSSTHRSLIKV